MMPENIDELTSQKIYLFASKMTFEKTFFFQVIAGTVNGKTAEFRANRLKSHFLGKENVNWYMQELNAPVYKQPETIVKRQTDFDGVTWKPAAIDFEF